MDGRATDDAQGTRVTAGGGMRGVLREVRALDLPDRAASLTFYAALCMLAGSATLVGALGLAGSYPATSDAVLDVLRKLGGTTGAGSFEGPVADLFREPEIALLLLVGGLAATAGLSALYLRAFRRAAHPLARDEGGLQPARGPLHILARVVVAELIVLTGLCAMATGSVAHAIGDVAGIPDDAVVAWDIVKWPVLLATAFVAFAALQRWAFSDPRVLASSSVASSQVLAALGWAFAITGFALYMASFGTFEDTYGTIGSGIVLLVWTTLFSMLYYVTPDLRVSGIAALGAGAALSAVTWLVVNAILAVCFSGFDSTDKAFAGFGTAAVLVAGLWISNVVVLLGVHLNALGISRADAEAVPPASPAGDAQGQDLVEIVSRALRNDAAYDGMLEPIAPGDAEAARLSELELDIGDWGFAYGVAWAVARGQDPQESDESVAARALDAALQVFRIYCGSEGWEERVRQEVERREPLIVPFEHAEPSPGNGHGRLRQRR